jgi:hypothetical protein
MARGQTVGAVLAGVVIEDGEVESLVAAVGIPVVAAGAVDAVAKPLPVPVRIAQRAEARGQRGGEAAVKGLKALAGLLAMTWVL